MNKIAQRTAQSHKAFDEIDKDLKKKALQGKLKQIEEIENAKFKVSGENN